MPLIDDILALLGKAKFFTSLDLKSGYWQVAMDEKDKEKTAFACHKGLFEFYVMPFGLSNAPAVFQELMTVVLQGCNGFATAYLDDILIFGATLEEHLKHLSIIFDKLRQHKLKLNVVFLNKKQIILALLLVKKELNLMKRKLKQLDLYLNQLVLDSKIFYWHVFIL